MSLEQSVTQAKEQNGTISNEIEWRVLGAARRILLVQGREGLNFCLLD